MNLLTTIVRTFTDSNDYVHNGFIIWAIESALDQRSMLTTLQVLYVQHHSVEP